MIKYIVFFSSLVGFGFLLGVISGILVEVL